MCNDLYTRATKWLTLGAGTVKATRRIGAVAARRLVRPLGFLTGLSLCLAGCAEGSTPSTHTMGGAVNSSLSSPVPRVTPGSTQSDTRAVPAMKLLQAAISTIKVANASTDFTNLGGAGHKAAGTYSQSYVGSTEKFDICSGRVTVTAFSGTLRDDGVGPVVSGPVVRSGSTCFNRMGALFSDLDPRALSISARPKPFSNLGPELIGYSVSFGCRKDRPGCMTGRSFNDGWFFTVADEATAQNAKTAIEILIALNSR